MGRRARRLAIGAAVGLVVLALLVVVAIPALPHIVRTLAVSRIRAMTGRPATIDALDLDLRRGALSIRGVRVLDNDGEPLATIDRIDAHVRLRALLAGHVSVEDLAITDSTVRVVRLGGGDFNISDLTKRRSAGGKSLDVTVDRFTLAGGTVLLEDRTVTPPRVWSSRDLAIVARNVSTLRGDGEAEATSTIDGAPVSVRIEQLRLAPVHLRAVVRAQNVDLSLVRVYLPANAPVLLDRGRLETTATVALDARDGVSVDVDGKIADALVVRRQQRDPFLLAPAVRVAVRQFTASNDGALAVARLEVEGATTLVNGDATPPARFELPRVTVSADGLAWPVQGPAKVVLSSPVPGGGHLSVRGSVTPKPATADVDVRLTRVNLTPWGRYVAPWLRVTGSSEVALTVHAALEPALTATGKGTARASNVVVADGERRLAAVELAEASGLDVQWPSRVTLGRVRLRRPSGIVERDAGGAIILPGVTNVPANAPVSDDARGSAPAAPASAATPGTASGPRPAPAAARTAAPSARLTLAMSELVLEDGMLTWRDAAVKPQATIRLARVNATVKDATWPLAAPIPVDLRAATPEGGRVELNGRVGLQPVSADLRVKARGVALAPYTAYLPLARPVEAFADADIATTVSRDPELQGRVRGTASLSRVAVLDGKRKVITADRVDARGLDVEWPARVAVERLALRQPWVLVEREERGGLPLLRMLWKSRAAETPPGDPVATPAASDASSPALASSDGPSPAPPPSVAVGELAIEDGGARIVDRAVSPPYSDDLSRVWLRVRGLATDSDKPARIDLRGMLGPGGALSAKGAVGVLGGPLFVDVTAEVRDLAVPRLNAYLRHYTGWNASNGRVTTRIVCRVDAGALTARNDVRIGRLQLVRAAAEDAGQQRIGLPLGLVVALLKDKQGNIRLSLPVGGRVDDPRFDFHDAIWSSVRTVAVHAIALPVSWIGRMRVGKDSKIQDIEIDPVVFEAGAATVAGDSTARLERVTDFMRSLPDVRMVVTPVVSLGDIEALKTRAIQERIAKTAAARRLPETEAAKAVFEERFRGHEPPEEVEKIVAALREVEEPPADDAAALAKERAQVVRDTLKKGGIDRDRVALNTEAGALETYDAGRVEFGLTDQVKTRRTLADLLRALVEALRRRIAALRG